MKQEFRANSVRGKKSNCYRIFQGATWANCSGKLLRVGVVSLMNKIENNPIESSSSVLCGAKSQIEHDHERMHRKQRRSENEKILLR